MFFVCPEETGRVKNCLGECGLKVTRPNDVCSKILVSNPGQACVWKFRFRHAF